MIGLIRNKEFIRYVVIGGVNTCISYCIYFVLLIFFPYLIAFSAAYFLGVITAYYLNTVIVFKSCISLKKFLSFPIVYIVQYTFNIFFLYIFVEGMSIDAKLAPIFGIIITMPITYLLSKYILQKPDTNYVKPSKKGFDNGK